MKDANTDMTPFKDYVKANVEKGIKPSPKANNDMSKAPSKPITNQKASNYKKSDEKTKAANKNQEAR